MLLEHEGYSISTAHSAREALRRAYEDHPEMILLDVNLPDQDGFAVLERLREQTDVPILMLTARAALPDRIRGWNLGAVDYILKPFDNRELLARVASHLRDERRRGPNRDYVVAGPHLTIDLAGHVIKVDGVERQLTPIEWRLLRALVEAGGSVVSMEELLKAGWGDAKFRDERSIKVRISSIRRKIGDRARPSRYIHTEREEGYRFDPKV